MRLLLPFLLLGLGISTYADEAQDIAKSADANSAKTLRGRSRALSLPSLGLSLKKPDPMVAAQLPNFPEGMGFLVNEVQEGGPSALAGVQVHDIIWKMGDQMLVNKAQLATLLRLRQAGDKVELSGFRSGKPQLFKVKLGEPKSPPEGVLANDESPFEEGGVTRVINSSEMFAKTTASDGEAELVKIDEGYQLIINDSKQKPIFNGTIPEGGSLDGVPPAWKVRVASLKRALDQAVNGELPAVRSSAQPSVQPRPRVVPQPTPVKQSVAP
ncbi:MAG: hypothetical protein RLZ22_1160 [Verrucomicrobiota bacterium]|jgi:hypothetical protein